MLKHCKRLWEDSEKILIPWAKIISKQKENSRSTLSTSWRLFEISLSLVLFVFDIMSLACLLQTSKKFPPGYIQPNQWPRLSGHNHYDHTYDPPVYQIPGHLKLRLVNYYEEDIYFDLKSDYVMPRDQQDGVVKEWLQTETIRRGQSSYNLVCSKR